MVVRGTVSVQMEKNAAVVLRAGGYAIMPSKELIGFRVYQRPNVELLSSLIALTTSSG